MPEPIQHPGEERSNQIRLAIAHGEPHSLRTYTPSQAVLSRSAGVFHWTPEGRKLYDFSSGVLVANLGHNPTRWWNRVQQYMGWSPELFQETPTGFVQALSLTAYNAITPIESMAVERLLRSVQRAEGGNRLNCVVWAASGSEAVTKAIWASIRRNPGRDMIVATRFGFHGKKGLAGAVTGSEKDIERDPRVRFVSFPMKEIDHYDRVNESIDLAPYRKELDALKQEFGNKLACLITEPYIGGGGSYHPPAAYLQMLQSFCRENEMMFILDEVQANFGRCGTMYAFERYGLEPDFVVLGKGLGNGVPVAATLGPGDVLSQMGYGETSDTWSANPLSCAAVLATLDEFESRDVLGNVRQVSKLFFEGLDRLRDSGLVAKVRGESRGLVYGIEMAPCGGLTDKEVAAACVKACYHGDGDQGIHLLGPLSGNVIRISPPLVITAEETRASLEMMARIFGKLAGQLKKK